MTYDLEKKKLGREPFVKCSLIMDYCALTAGVAPCTATETGDAKCFNTRATCNDVENYDKTTKKYTFCQPRSSLPQGVNMFPVLDKKIQKAATSTTAGSGLGKRAVIKLRLKDFIHSDKGIDPYVDERSYNPEEQGTFWGKFLTRNPYYEGRTLEVDYGYIGTPFSLSDFETQAYDITEIDGVTKSEVIITGKDVLVRTYEQKAQYPKASTGKLLEDITISAATATLTPAGIGDVEYPSSGTLVIGKDVKTFTRVGDVLTLTAHARWGSTNKEHKLGDTVQVCETFDENIVVALDRILTVGAGIPSSFIPTAEWEIERDLWLSNSNVFGILIKPESIEKVIGEWSEVFMFDIWSDVVTRTIPIKALSPEPSGVSISAFTERSNIIEGSLKIKRESKQRFTEVRVYYNKIDYTDKNDTENFNNLHISTDISRASSDQYGDNSIKDIFSRWFVSDSNASQLAGRYLARFSDTPEIITFKLDQKDDGNLTLAGRIAIDSWQLQDFNGANEIRRYQVLEINEGNESGHDFTVKALTSSFVGRYFFITPDGFPDYSGATEEQKEAYGFISQADGFFADGNEAYKII
jgi:hypothetical protein